MADPREDAKQFIIEAAAVHEERCAGAVAKAVGELKSVAGRRSDGSLWSDVDPDVPESEQWNLALSHLKAVNLQNDAEKSVRVRQRDGRVQEDPRAPQLSHSTLPQASAKRCLTMSAGILTYIKDTHGDEPTVMCKMAQAQNRLPKAFQNKEDTCTPSSKISKP